MDYDYDSEFKVIFIGEYGIGAKTSLINSIIGEKFKEASLPTSSVNIVSISKTNNLGHKIKMNLWDTVGQEQFRSVNNIYLKNSHCVILGYDITRKKTFAEITNYHYNNVKEKSGEVPLIYLVANKIDLWIKEEVSEGEAKAFAEEKKIKYFRVSSKTRQGVDLLINDIANSLTDKFIKKKGRS